MKDRPYKSTNLRQINLFTSKKQLNRPLLTHFPPSDAMTECQKMLHDHIKYSRSGYRVECTEDGMFAARQCDSSVEKCWCAERSTGRMIFGTYHASHMVGPYDCENCKY